MNQKKQLICIVGPTAVGKSKLCLKLAKNFETVILSSDSRQFYREMELGTAKPSSSEMEEIPHYFINSLSIFNPYDIKKFEQEALSLLEKLFEEKNVVIVTGGSGLYLEALVNGVDDMPQIPKNIRENLNELYRQKGIADLQEQLKKADPVYYEQVDLQNPQRLIRALEVTLGTGKPYSDFRKRNKVQRPFRTIWIGLQREREELYQRIADRMDEMIENGLFEEARQLFPHRELNALQTLGYSEIFAHLEGQYDQEETIRLLKRNSRRYAKRQMTWFRKNPDITWFHPEQMEDIMHHLENQMGA